MLSKQEWGNITWKLFHTLSVKIKQDSLSIIPVLLNEFYIICHNLPCPECSNHAVNYFRNINLNHLNSREKLCITMNDFHNAVNIKLSKPTVKLDDSIAKYSKLSTYQVVREFLKVFSKSTGSHLLMMRNMHQNITVNRFREFMNSHIKHFEN